jgi:ABC-type molybdenum transport system ATPase subunit/photorepair protein PhrA
VSAPVVLRHVALADDGPTLAWTADPGSRMVILGRAGAGKSRLLRVVAGEHRPGRGTREGAKGRLLAPGGAPGRAKLGAYARDAADDDLNRGTAALHTLGLWDLRNEPVQSLTVAARAAADLLPALAGRDALVAVDTLLDTLDPWARMAFLAAWEERRREGAALAVATNRAELVEAAELIVVLETARLRFVGTWAELRERAGPVEAVVEARHVPGAVAAVDPFEISVKEREDGRLVLTAREGQDVAARLLLEGYGNVRAVVVREATLEEALSRL